MKLFVVKVGQSEWNFAKGEQSYGNHWELRRYPDLKSADKDIWEERCEIAANYDDREELWVCNDCNHQQEESGECEMCESSNLELEELEDAAEFVERTTGGAVFPYDPTKEAHLTLPGYEELRPERKAYLQEVAEEYRTRKLEELHTRKRWLLEEIEAIDAQLEKLNDSSNYRQQNF